MARNLPRPAGRHGFLLGAVAAVLGIVLILIDRATASVYTLSYAAVGSPPTPPLAVITGWSLGGSALLAVGLALVSFELGRRAAAPDPH